MSTSTVVGGCDCWLVQDRVSVGGVSEVVICVCESEWRKTFPYELGSGHLNVGARKLGLPQIVERLAEYAQSGLSED